MNRFSEKKGVQSLHGDSHAIVFNVRYRERCA